MPTTNAPALKIIALGGLHEIGKNTWVFEYNDEIMLLDGGLSFPDNMMPGVNVVLPDMTYLRENKHKIKGMIVTHGHEDHIGAISFHLKQFEIPVIYGPRLAMALLEDKLREAGVLNRTELRRVMPRDVVRVGTNFFVEFIRNTHSIADSFSIAINTPAGMVIHSGDFKIDHTPVDGEFFDLARLAEHGEKGVLALISDSTNAELPGITPSERAVYPNLEKYIMMAKGRVIITTFASSVHRVNMILDIADKQGRVVGVVGRSMLNVIAHARNLDRLMALGANVIYGKDKGIHVSGHGSQEEHKMMLALVRPKFFFPAHGELRMLRQHAKMAESMGIPSENIVIAENGDVVEVCQDYMRIVDKVPSGVELVDSSRDGMVKGDVLRDRQQISGEGIFTIAVSVGLDGKLSTNPDIQLSGVVLPMEHSQIIALVAKAIDNSLANSWGNYARNVGSLEIDWIGLRGQLERDLTRVLRQQIQSKPMIVFLLQTPPNSTQSAPAPAAKPNALGVTLKSGSNKVIPKVEQESSNGNGAAIEAPVATGAATASVGRRKRTAATV